MNNPSDTGQKCSSYPWDKKYKWDVQYSHLVFLPRATMKAEGIQAENRCVSDLDDRESSGIGGVWGKYYAKKSNVHRKSFRNLNRIGLGSLFFSTFLFIVFQVPLLGLWMNTKLSMPKVKLNKAKQRSTTEL